MRKNRRNVSHANESISSVFSLADSLKGSEEKLSRRYMQMIEKIAKRMDITLSPRIKRAYCKKCKTVYSSRTRIRLSRGVVTITCDSCNNVRRIPYR